MSSESGRGRLSRRRLLGEGRDRRRGAAGGLDGCRRPRRNRRQAAGGWRLRTIQRGRAGEQHGPRADLHRAATALVDHSSEGAVSDRRPVAAGAAARSWERQRGADAPRGGSSSDAAAPSPLLQVDRCGGECSPETSKHRLLPLGRRERPSDVVALREASPWTSSLHRAYEGAELARWKVCAPEGRGLFRRGPAG